LKQPSAPCGSRDAVSLANQPLSHTGKHFAGGRKMLSENSRCSSKIRIFAAVAAGLKASFRSGFPVEVAHGLTYIITTASTFIERDNAGDLVRLFLSTITVIAGS
jgi:hypothetical protein